MNVYNYLDFYAVENMKSTYMYTYVYVHTYTHVYDTYLKKTIHI
jgi:hypothetical protein